MIVHWLFFVIAFTLGLAMLFALIMVILLKPSALLINTSTAYYMLFIVLICFEVVRYIWNMDLLT